MDYSDNYYVRTKSFNLNTNKLSESLQCDVCIIGAGLSGISSALYLSKINPSLNIVILEKNKVGWGASGRNGGQLLHSFSGENYSGQKHTQEEIKTLWLFTLEAVREVKKNIKDLNIQCDLIEGYIQAAVNKSHDEELKKYVDQLQTEYNYESATYLSKSQMEQYFESPYYKSAMYDSECGQIHPLNYCLGLAKELLKNKNCKIFEDTGVISYNSENKVTINTEKNINIKADKLIICCNAYIGDLNKSLRRKIMPVKTYVSAFTQIPKKELDKYFRKPITVGDMLFVLNYFRLDSDNNLIFGGGVSYSNIDPINLELSLKKSIRKILPGLEKFKAWCTWSGHVAITVNRFPHIGSIDNNIFFAQGYSGHGLAITTMVGKMLAEVISNQNNNLSLFEKFKHKNFPGFGIIDKPLLVLAMSYFKLKDHLSLK
ncbi:FAD-binding oxidoreductase [Alphaproteobacteria bacterium]|nr:FAD-binding oxidoreductase [Alphaproteobacteria bacterium]